MRVTQKTEPSFPLRATAYPALPAMLMWTTLREAPSPDSVVAHCWLPTSPERALRYLYVWSGRGCRPLFALSSDRRQPLDLRLSAYLALPGSRGQ